MDDKTIKVLTYCQFQSPRIGLGDEGNQNIDACFDTLGPEIKVVRQKLLTQTRVYTVFDVFGVQKPSNKSSDV